MGRQPREGVTSVFTNFRSRTRGGAPTIGRREVPPADMGGAIASYSASASDFVNNGTFRSTVNPGRGGKAFVCPTARTIVQTVPNCHVGDSFNVQVLNAAPSGAVNLAGNTGVTLTLASSTIAAGAAATLDVCIVDTTDLAEKVSVGGL